MKELRRSGEGRKRERSYQYPAVIEQDRDGQHIFRIGADAFKQFLQSYADTSDMESINFGLIRVNSAAQLLAERQVGSHRKNEPNRLFVQAYREWLIAMMKETVRQGGKEMQSNILVAIITNLEDINALPREERIPRIVAEKEKILEEIAKSKRKASVRKVLRVFSAPRKKQG